MLACGVPCSGYVDDFIILLAGPLAPVHFNFLLELSQELGFEAPGKPGGCQVGKLVVPIELLGSSYIFTENSLKVEAPNGKLCAPRKQRDKLAGYV